MLHADPFTEFLARQKKLYETAHTNALELKPLAYRLEKQGIRYDKTYANPDFVLLPFQNCKRLSALGSKQRSILSAMFFALQHVRTAHLESLTLTYNLETARRNFNPYSEPYMVLFHETDEEFDHLASFHVLSRSFLGAPLNDEFHYCYSFAETLRCQLLDWFGNCQPSVAGAFYLLFRFLQNVSSKQIESYIFSPNDSYHYDPLAVEFTQAHARDEARHFTTSLDLGMHLFHRNDEKTKESIREFIRKCLVGWIVNLFSPHSRFFEIPAPFLSNEFVNFPQSLSLLSLRKALNHPDFGADFTYEGILEEWAQKSVELEPKPVYQRSLFWVAWQLDRFSRVLELDLSAQFLSGFLVRDEPAERARKIERAELALSCYRNALAQFQTPPAY